MISEGRSTKGENYSKIPIQNVKCTLMVLPIKIIKQDYTGQKTGHDNKIEGKNTHMARTQMLKRS